MKRTTLKLLVKNFGKNVRSAINDKNTMLQYCADLKHDIKLIGSDFNTDDYKQSVIDIEKLIFDISECVKYSDEHDYTNALARFCNIYNIQRSAINIDVIAKIRNGINFSCTSSYIVNMYYTLIFL